MVRAIGKVIGGLLVAVVAMAIVFVAGMRAKSPVVLNAVRRSSRRSKRFVMKTAGTPGASASVVRHLGRTSGTAYETPVVAVPTDDGFVIALPYGPNTDWLKNVLASGSATIVHDGSEHAVGQPEVIELAEATSRFGPNEQRAHRLFAVKQGLRVRTVPAPIGATSTT
jgi:deazaflavin-dependent oxidoreductase (nitroreductase family)